MPDYRKPPPDMVRMTLIKLLTKHPNQTARWYADEGVLNITSVQQSLTIMRKKGLVGRSLQHPDKPHNGTHNQYVYYMAVEVV